jgi:Holliday junction resolvase RusA-like endonuclease
MVCLKIPGKPMGKQRPRLGAGHTFNPQKTVNYETLVKELYVMNKLPKLEGPIKMEITALYEIPKSKSKKQQEEMRQDKVRPTVKPDMDNIIKIIADALNGIAYDDDKQIVQVTCSKWYSTDPRVIVYLYEAEV